MARQLYARLQSEDVVVADSAYGTYVDLVLVHSEERRCRMSANITPVTVIFAGARS